MWFRIEARPAEMPQPYLKNPPLDGKSRCISVTCNAVSFPAAIVSEIPKLTGDPAVLSVMATLGQLSRVVCCLA